jgi:hypothetical protein
MALNLDNNEPFKTFAAQHRVRRTAFLRSTAVPNRARTLVAFV